MNVKLYLKDDQYMYKITGNLQIRAKIREQRKHNQWEWCENTTVMGLIYKSRKLYNCTVHDIYTIHIHFRKSTWLDITISISVFLIYYDTIIASPRRIWAPNHSCIHERHILLQFWIWISLRKHVNLIHIYRYTHTYPVVQTYYEMYD